MNRYLLFIFTFLLSGCSAIINGKSESLTVRSADPEAILYVNGMKVGKDSAVWSQQRGKTSILEAKKDGCATGVIHTDTNFDPTTLLGIFIDFGIVSIPVDAINGTMWKSDKQIYTINPICPVN